MVDVKILENNYYINMIPCPYKIKKGGEIKIYPVLLKDYNIYSWAKEILLIDKNAIGDIDIIQMSYLNFLINKILANKEEYSSKLYWIFKLCLKEENVKLGDNCIIILDNNKLIKKIISSKEFDDISKIILSYNDINYDDRYISPEVKEIAEEYYKVKYRDITIPNLQKKKSFVSSKIGKTFSELNELPYREFELIYEACKDSEIYIGQKIIQGSYKYDVKEDISHPLYEKKRDFYDEIFTNTNVLAEKGISGVEQLNM